MNRAHSFCPVSGKEYHRSQQLQQFNVESSSRIFRIVWIKRQSRVAQVVEELEELVKSKDCHKL